MLSKPARSFGFEAEPDPFAVHTITADFYAGSQLVGSISRAINGQAGARLIAVNAGGTPVDKIQISSTADFAVAQIRYGSACRVSVTAFGQAQAPWGSTQYDDIDKTMQQKGCAVTAVAMGLTGRGIATDPGTLNELLKNNRGYSAGGNINWAVAAQAGGGRYQPIGSNQAIENALCNGQAVVVGVNLNAQGTPGHFVLVIGKEGASFTIKDPADGREKTLAAYGNSYAFRGAIGGGSGAVSPNLIGLNLVPQRALGLAGITQIPLTLSLAIDDAALSARDAQGNEVGIDPRSGAVLSSIPGSSAWADRLDDDLTGARGVVTTSFVYVPNAVGVYALTIVPTKTGTSTLIVNLLDGTPASLAPTQLKLLAVAGQSVTLTLSVSADGVPVILRSGGFAGAGQDVAAGVTLELIRPGGIVTSLKQKLDAAEAALKRGDRSASLNVLSAFENEVRAQSGKGIDILAAEILLADVAALRLLVGRP